MLKTLVLICLGVIIVILSFAACNQPVSQISSSPPQTPIEFYADNTITIVVGWGAGGGTDFFARLFASYWPEVTNGKALVRNMPSAGSIVGTNYVYTAEPDGLTLGIQSKPGNVVIPVLMEEPAVKWKLGEFVWLGGMISDQYGLVVSPKLGITSLQELQKVKGLLFGSQGVTATSSTGAALVINALSLKDAIIVPGYESNADTALAVGKGEVDAMILDEGGMMDFGVDGWIQIPPLCIIGSQKSIAYPTATVLTEIMDTSPAMLKYLNIFTTLKGRYILFAPPDVPLDRIEFLRSAFLKVVNQEGIQKQMKLRWPVIDNPLTGEDIAEIVAKAEGISIQDLKAYDDLTRSYIR
jgi:tripartite-type tricarboxylate transporter receptor subunit TctC